MTAAKMTSDTSQSVSRPRPIRRRIMLVDTTGLLAIRADGLHGGRFSFGVGELGGGEVLRETQGFGGEGGRGGVAAPRGPWAAGGGGGGGGGGGRRGGGGEEPPRGAGG